MGEAPLCDPTPLSTSVENKGPTPIRPTGDRPVEPRFRVISTPNPVISLLASDRCELLFASFLPEQITNITPKSNAIKCECKANYTQNAIPKS
jgi:hypothetical protein